MARRPVTVDELRELAGLLRRERKYHPRSGLKIEKHVKRCCVVGMSIRDIELLALRIESDSLRPGLGAMISDIPEPAAAPSVTPQRVTTQLPPAPAQSVSNALDQRDYFGLKRGSQTFKNRQFVLLERIPEAARG